MRVSIDVDDLINMRVAALGNDDNTEKLRAINAELTAQLEEKDRCIAQLREKLALHESSLQFIDGLVKEQAERIRKMTTVEEPAGDADWIPWAGGECPVGDDVTVEVKLSNGKSHIGTAYVFKWKHDVVSPEIIAYRIVESKAATSDDDGWVPWAGGECPVDDDVKVEVEYLSGINSSGFGDDYRWEHRENSYDIIAYRIVE